MSDRTAGSETERYVREMHDVVLQGLDVLQVFSMVPGSLYGPCLPANRRCMWIFINKVVLLPVLSELEGESNGE